jgi:L-lactate dehydrogenase complex protein LldE
MERAMTGYPEKPKKIYYFGTCLMDMFYPEAGMAGIKLIQREGVQVIFPLKQTCCGQPAYNSGFPKEAKKVALRQVQLFPKNYPIVVPSGSCAGMMKHHYPLLFAGDAQLESIQRFSNRIVELSEFLVKTLKIKLPDRGTPIKVTWHTSCHALREMNIIEDSKSLIRQLQNVELVELQNENECCGFGGTFAVKQPEISGAMVIDKVADIHQTGASRLLAGDCGCLMNITGAMNYQNLPVKGQHIAEFIWERINGK